MRIGKKLTLVLLAFVMLLGAPEPGAATPQADEEYVRGAAKSVLTLQAKDREGNTIGYGSGFVIIDNYTLVTSCHLVKDAAWVEAYNSEDDMYLLNKIIAADEKLDIALLEFFSPTNLKPTPLQPFDAYLASNQVTAIGGPYWGQNDIAPCTISMVRREAGVKYIQFEADLTQSMDGGVLLDMLGQAAGMIMGPVHGGKNTYQALDIQAVKSFANDYWKQDRTRFYDYFGKGDAAQDKTGDGLPGGPAPTPAVAPNPTEAPKPTQAPMPQMNADYFLQVGDEAFWDKKDGYWQVNPQLINSSQSLSADRFTLSFYCKNAKGEVIARYGDGEYILNAVFDMLIGPGEKANPGYTWLEGFENVQSINMAISQIHLPDGRTIDIPMEQWQVVYIELE